MWYSCVVTVTVTIVWKRRHLNIICREHLSDVGDEMCLVLIVLVFLWDPTSSWLLFNELKNKACRNSLIVAQFRDRYIQVKDNEIVDSESLKGDRVRIYRWPLYTGQLNSKYKGWFLESRSVTVVHRVTAIYRAVIYRFDCTNFCRFPPIFRPILCLIKVFFGFFYFASADENGQDLFFFFEDTRALIMAHKLRVNSACSWCHVLLNLLTELLGSQLSI